MSITYEEAEIQRLRKRKKELTTAMTNEKARAHKRPEGSGGGKQTDKAAIKSGVDSAEKHYRPLIDETSARISKLVKDKCPSGFKKSKSGKCVKK